MELSDKQKADHESNKVVRHALAHAHYVLTNRVQWMKEEFVEVMNTCAVLEALCLDLQKKIEEIEPPKVDEPKAEEPKAKLEDIISAFEGQN